MDAACVCVFATASSTCQAYWHAYIHTFITTYFAHPAPHPSLLISPRLVRINNHDQIDLQEYLGSYVSDESGRLAFREGPLVQAVRHGHWVVLDELNLAPTEVRHGD